MPAVCHAPLPPCPPRFSQTEEEGGEEAVEVICLPAGGYDLELYTPEQLYQHRPLEAPVSPAKTALKAPGRKRKRVSILDELHKRTGLIFSLE